MRLSETRNYLIIVALNAVKALSACKLHEGYLVGRRAAEELVFLAILVYEEFGYAHVRQAEHLHEFCDAFRLVLHCHFDSSLSRVNGPVDFCIAHSIHDSLIVGALPRLGILLNHLINFFTLSLEREPPCQLLAVVELFDGSCSSNKLLPVSIEFVTNLHVFEFHDIAG